MSPLCVCFVRWWGGRLLLLLLLHAVRSLLLCPPVHRPGSVNIIKNPPKAKFLELEGLTWPRAHNKHKKLKFSSYIRIFRVIYEEGLPIIYEEMRKYFPIYEETVNHIWLCNCSILNFLILYMRKILFYFLSLKGLMLSFSPSWCSIAVEHRKLEWEVVPGPGPTIKKLILSLPLTICAEPVFVNISRSRGIDSQPGGQLRQTYLTFRPARLYTGWRNRFLRIDSCAS